MSYESEHILIDLIQHYSFLHDKSSKHYKDNNKKNNAWDSIAKAMSMTVEDVQKMWKNLRDRYNKEKKILDAPSGASAEEGTVTWPLFQYMGFIKQHIATRKRISNVQITKTLPKKQNIQTASKTIERATESPKWNDAIVDIVGNVLVAGTTNDIDADVSAGASRPGSPSPELDVTCVRSPSPIDLFTEDPSQTPTTSQQKRSASPQGCIPLQDLSQKKTSQKAFVKKNKAKNSDDTVVTEALGCLTNFIKSKEKPDKNVAFGNYVGMSLSDMPIKEQNYKRLKIVEIISAPYDSESDF